MTCHVGEHCPGTPTLMMSQHYDERADALLRGEAPWYEGESVLADRAHAAMLRRTGRDIPLRHFEGPMFWCSRERDDATLVCPCGHWSGFLCDTPIGDGRTCDRPMCWCCRENVGPELDRCAYHKAVAR